MKKTKEDSVELHYSNTVKVWNQGQHTEHKEEDLQELLKEE